MNQVAPSQGTWPPGTACIPIQADLASKAGCDALASELMKRESELDILVNNAGYQQTKKTLDEITDEQFERTFRTNVFAPFFITKAALPHMPPGAAIIITASGCGTTMKDYGHMFRNDPLAAEAAEVSRLACDISELLERLGVPEQAPQGIRVAYHAACSLQHGQQVKTAPKTALKRAGFLVLHDASSSLLGRPECRLTKL